MDRASLALLVAASLVFAASGAETTTKPRLELRDARLSAIRSGAAGQAAAASGSGVVRTSAAIPAGRGGAAGEHGPIPAAPHSRRLLQQQQQQEGDIGADIAAWLSQVLHIPFFGAQGAPLVAASPRPTGPLPQLPPGGFDDTGGMLTSLPLAPAPAPTPAPVPASPAAAAVVAPPAARAAAPAEVDAAITLAFVSTGLYGSSMHMPSEPRAMSVAALRADGGEAAVQRGVPYAERQTVTLRLPAGGRYTLEVRDEGAACAPVGGPFAKARAARSARTSPAPRQSSKAAPVLRPCQSREPKRFVPATPAPPPADEELLLFQSEVGAVDASAGAPLELGATIRLQPLELQARFTRLAWSGGLFLAPNESAETNIAVIGAKVGGGLGSGSCA
jgi:hypothetical protein